MSGRTAAGLLVAAQFAPGLASVPWVRELLAPALHGLGRPGHVALTFDDGPDAASTPHFLELLARRNVRATFFLLGSHVAANATLLAEMASAGHELGVHGWDHRCLAAKRPLVLDDELRRTKDAIQDVIHDVTDIPVRRYRPPYGWMTGEGLLAARRHGLQTVLWTAWGRDWSAGASAAGIVSRVERTLPPGGTLLLHDSDRTCAAGSWRRTLAATEELLDRWDARRLEVGPLAEHGVAAGARARPLRWEGQVAG